MIKRTIHINGWTVYFYFAIDTYYQDEIIDHLKVLGANRSIIRKTIKNMDSDLRNNGFTFTNQDLKTSIVCIGMTSSGSEFLNTVFHELRHLSDDICSYYEKSKNGEAVAYMLGDIMQQLSDIICKYSCDKCRQKLGI